MGSFHEVIPRSLETSSAQQILHSLKACCFSRDIQKGRLIHGSIAGSECNVYVASTLVNMYAKCGSMIEARSVFDSMADRNVVSWTAIIAGYVENGEARVSLELFACMISEGCSPNTRTIVAALRAAATLGLKAESIADWGLAIHALASRGGLDRDADVASGLVIMYGKCGSVVHARRVFEGMKNRDVVVWNMLLIGHAENGAGISVLELLARMRLEGFQPNSRTFVAAFKACKNLIASQEEKLSKLAALHSLASSAACDADRLLTNTLMDAYGKCSSPANARHLFDAMCSPSLVSWNALMFGYVENGDAIAALEMFARLQCQESVSADERTYVAVLKATALERNLAKGRAVHAALLKNIPILDVILTTALVEMYIRCDETLADSWRVFDTTSCANAVPWTSMILAYVDRGEGTAALRVFSRMRAEGCRPNSVTFVAALKACASLAADDQKLEMGFAIHRQACSSACEQDLSVANTLIGTYASCGCTRSACRVFDAMPERNLVSWNTLLFGYVENGGGEAAMELYDQMDCAADGRTLVAAFKACTMLASLERGKRIHDEARRSGLENESFVASSILDFYCKCGSIEDAQALFDSLEVKDMVCWTVLMAGYGSRGDAVRVLELFRLMRDRGFQPDHVTFLCLLSACSHAGMVEQGKQVLEDMESKYGITPKVEHYSCILDMLARANEVDAAAALVKRMPCEPDLVAWRTVIGACYQ